MNLRRAKTVLFLLTALLLLASVAVGVWSVWAVPAAPTIGSKEGAKTRPSIRLLEPPPLDEFRQLARRPLRGPLYDPPPKPKPNPNQPPRKNKRSKKTGRPAAPRVSIRLVGTMLEDGHSMAIFTGPSGKMEVRGEGQKLESLDANLTVQRIGLDKVTLSRQGSPLTLTLESRSPGNGP